MTYKTILISAILAGSMQQAWGMEQKANGNNNPIEKKEVSDTARLAAAMEQLNLTLQAGFVNLSTALDNQTRKLDNLVKVQKIMTQKMVEVGKGQFLSDIEDPDFSELDGKNKKK